MLAGLLVAGWIHAAWHLATNWPGHDSSAYWAVDLQTLYLEEYGTTGLFTYSPAAALLAQPLSLLPQSAFVIGWSALLLVAVVGIAGREAIVWLVFPPLVWLIVIGNIEILLAVAAVVGLRYPWAWSFVLLTKVTPGVGLLWFAVRREWKPLAIALGATGAFVVISYVFLSDAWHAWLAFLLDSQGSGGWVPLLPRLVAAAALVIWGARTDRRWTVVVAVVLAVPHFWFASLGGLVALAALGFSWQAAVSRPSPGGSGRTS